MQNVTEIMSCLDGFVFSADIKGFSKFIRGFAKFEAKVLGFFKALEQP